MPDAYNYYAFDHGTHITCFEVFVNHILKHIRYSSEVINLFINYVCVCDTQDCPLAETCFYGDIIM